MSTGNIVFLQPPAAKAILISQTENAAQTLGKVCRTFEGSLSSDPVSEEKVQHYLKQLQNTALQGPLEMVQYVFLLKDVTRSFQQQITRYRVGASFIAQSLRFTQKQEAVVLDTTGGAAAYRQGIKSALEAYWEALDSGVPIEDARGVLPLNICSDFFASFSLRTLINIYEQRQCIQAQRGEFPAVLRQIKKQLPLGLQDLLQMRCDKDGVCIFASEWDRPCPKRKILSRG